MADYRPIKTSYWTDPMIRKLKADERYLYLYFLTCPQMTNLGIVEVSFETIEFETGLPQKRVEEAINSLQEKNRIYYHRETEELVVRNWLKHNITSSPHLLANIKKAFYLLKCRALVKLLYGAGDLRIDEIQEIVENDETVFNTTVEPANKVLLPREPRFQKPTIIELEVYIAEIEGKFKAQDFFDFYESSGWKLSNGNQMKDWKSACRVWKSRDDSGKNPNKPQRFGKNLKTTDVKVDWLEDYLKSV